MPRTRSRANTEGKFLNAVIELVAHDGCCALGVNAVAHKAGADKVLIYRYFGNLQGLLLRVAESRQWLPSVDELLDSLKLEVDLPASEVIRPLARLFTHHIRADRATHQILRWRKAEANPLTVHFSEQWRDVWQQLSEHLSTGLDYSARENWKRLMELTALIIEAELCDERVNSGCIDHIANGIVTGRVSQETATTESLFEDQLPTNLL
ncbi:MAG: TetR/AcrR family transcriptional regulator [Opitutae bacterium]|jgi:AcrR family transcriptional regulator|nr:TetR/AcrR family transcriptional regulator [Opitutae bacterium]